MIQVYHWAHDINPDVSWGIKDALIGEDTHYQACYFAGLNPPRYPLPAIRLEVDLDWMGTLIRQESVERWHIVLECWNTPTFK